MGDPLVQKNQLIGIYNGYDGVGPFTFMSMAKCRDWIIKNIKDNSEGDEADGIDDGDIDFSAHENVDYEDSGESSDKDSHEGGDGDGGNRVPDDMDSHAIGENDDLS